MKLWMLQVIFDESLQIQNSEFRDMCLDIGHYSEADDYIVIAENEQDARQMVHDDVKNTNMARARYWKDPIYTSCEEIQMVPKILSCSHIY